MWRCTRSSSFSTGAGAAREPPPRFAVVRPRRARDLAGPALARRRGGAELAAGHAAPGGAHADERRLLDACRGHRPGLPMGRAAVDPARPRPRAPARPVASRRRGDGADPERALLDPEDHALPGDPAV